MEERQSGGKVISIGKMQLESLESETVQHEQIQR